MFQLCFNLNTIHDSVGKALRTANQDRVTPNSHLNRLRLRLAASQGESLMRAIYPLPWVQRFSGGKPVLWAYTR
jgi:hypothetical protein